MTALVTGTISVPPVRAEFVPLPAQTPSSPVPWSEARGRVLGVVHGHHQPVVGLTSELKNDRRPLAMADREGHGTRRPPRTDHDHTCETRPRRTHTAHLIHAIRDDPHPDHRRTR